MRVRVYRNLRSKCWSVKYKGKVIAHLDSIILKNAKMIVSEKGRQRVLDRKQKAVHAYIEGEWVQRGKKGCATEISYNPYYKGHFFKVKDKTPVEQAERVYLREDGKVFQKAKPIDSL